MLKKYPSLLPLGKKETKNYLNNPDDIINITEKFDGANVRITLKKGKLVIGSRKEDYLLEHILKENPNFLNGYAQWCKTHEETLKEVLTHSPKEIVLVGEWMTKHTIHYALDEVMVIFYDVLLRVHPEKEGTYRHVSEDEVTEGVYQVANNIDRETYLCMLEEYGFQTAQTLYQGPIKECNLEDYKEQPSSLNPDVTAEGIVIKNPAYRNQYGRQVHVKVVNERFEERKQKNREKQPGKKYYDYTTLLETYGTERRVEKLLHANPEQTTGTMQDMTWLPQLVAHDILKESLDDLPKLAPVLDFKQYQKQCSQHVAKILLERKKHEN